MIRIKTGYTFGFGARHWWFFIVTGLFAWTSPYLIGVYTSLTEVVVFGGALILLGLILRFSTIETLIDTDKNLFSNRTNVLGIGKKEWMVIPRLSAAILTSAKVTYWNPPNGITPTFKSTHTVYSLGLFSDQEQPDLVLQFDRIAPAQRAAQKISAALDLKLVQQL